MKAALLIIIVAVAFSASAYDFDTTCSDQFPTLHEDTLLIELIKQNSLKEQPKDKIQEIMEAKDKTKSQLSNNLLKCLEFLMRRGFFKASQVFIDEVIDPFEIESVDFVKNIGNQIKKEIDVLAVSSRRNVQQVTPVFQWGQSNTSTFIQIKFAHRFDSPGCVDVKDEVVNITNNSLYFSAHCIQANSPIKFVLNLSLYDEIVPENSLWKLESVGKTSLLSFLLTDLTTKSTGRLYVQLAKVHPKIWIRLTESTEKISQMQIWWDLKREHADAMEEYSRLLEELEDKKIEERNRKRNRKNKKSKKGDEL